MRPDQPVGEQVQAQPHVEGVARRVLQVLDLDGHHRSPYAADVVVHRKGGELLRRLGPVGVAERGAGEPGVEHGVTGVRRNAVRPG